MTNKFTRQRVKNPFNNKDAKAEVKVPSLSDNLTPTPRERRDLRRQTALDEADKAVARRQVKPNGKI